MASMTPLQRTLKLLAVRQRTERELLLALARAKVPPAEREAAVARVKELGYLDDSEVARSRARTLLGRGTAPRLAARKLAAQGIAAAEARAAADEAAEGAGEEDLARAAVRRALRGRTPDAADKQKLLRKLAARGHKPSVLAKILGTEWEGDDPEDDEPL